MDITEKWLGDIGGWQVLKAARSLLERGVVGEVKREGTDVRGLVTEGPKRYTSGLAIRSRTDVENLCTCPTSRGRGMICAHSIAVALSTLRKAPSGLQTMTRPAPASSVAPLASRPMVTPSAVATPPPGRFSIFLPDNLLNGTFTGQAAVFLKFEPGAGTSPDGMIAGWLREQGLRPGSMPLMLTKNDLATFLNAAAGHEMVIAGKPSAPITDEIKVSVALDPVRLPVVAKEDDEDVVFTLDSSSIKPIAAPWCFCHETRSLFALPTLDTETRRLVGEVFESGKGVRSLAWMVQQRAALDESLILRLEGKSLGSLHLMPLPCEFELHLDGSMQVVEARLYAVHGTARWIVMEGSLSEVSGVKFPLESTEHEHRFYSRNIEREKSAAERLFDIGFEAASSTTLRLQGQDKVARFYASELPRLQRVFRIVEGDRWRSATKGLLRITPRTLEPKHLEEQRSSNDWLSLDIAYEASDGFRITRAEVMQMIRTGRRNAQAPSGKKYLLDEEACAEFEESLRDLDSEMTTTGVKVRADKAQFLFTTDDQTFTERQAASWQSEAWVAERLPDLAKLLRPYQMDGIRWFEASARGAKAGLLADDMGLGKTLQAISMIRLLDRSAPVLVVCPKSLIANWEREVERFAPDLKVLSIHGADRKESFAEVPDHHVIITTYQLVVRDLSLHRKHTYAAVVLDEASYIRNPDTEAAKALRGLKAERRFALTGTPLENGVRDLWSIYHFLMPGYLGSRDSFKDRFEKPLAAGINTPESRKVSERLRKLVRPYFLRRTKKEVLKDLPEKIEQVLWCDLSRPQSEVYRRLVEEGQSEVRDARKRSGKSGAKMTMFTVLLRLRQACCDLRMTGVDPEVLKQVSADDLSGKLGMWRERLDEILTNGGKVIVFSQFVKFLHLLRAELERDGIPFCYLDGQSNDRGEQVQRFQTDAQSKVFLISLKAGGYGLNLTAADHVMLMDPWWNPAVEAQAIDRAHRLGQERVVTALRLVTRGTVEEKILKLQAQKRGLIEAALDDAAPMMSGLTEDDLAEVLEV